MERTWERGGGIIYVPAARWSWSPRPPATQLCCAASHQQFHQHQHQHQRQGMHAYTHVVQCQHRFVCLDIRLLWNLESLADCYLCNRPANEVFPDHLQNKGWLYWTVLFATGRPRSMIEISCNNKLSYWTNPFCNRSANEDNPDLFT